MVESNVVVSLQLKQQQTMTLTPEQVKEARKFCKANGINPKEVSKELGNGFWDDKCNGTFEGYLQYMLNDNSNGSILLAGLREAAKTSHVNAMYNELKETTL